MRASASRKARRRHRALLADQALHSERAAPPRAAPSRAAPPGAAAVDAYTPDQIAVLYRTNAQSRVIEEEFGRYAIGYQVIGGTKFYERAEIRDLLAYLWVIQNPDDEQRLLRIVNTPRRGIGKTTLQRLQGEAATVGETLWDVMARAEEVPAVTPGAAAALTQFVKLIDDLRGLAADKKAAEVVRAVLEHSGYEAALRAQKTLEAEGRLENLEELAGVAQEFDERRQQAGEEPRLQEFLQEVSLFTDTDALVENEAQDHPHDPAQCQGARVPRRVHHRHGGGRLPPPAFPRRAEHRGGAAPRLRGHHARHAPPLPGARAGAQPVGQLAVRHTVALPG